MYQHGLGVAFSGERAAKTAQREYAFLTGFETLAHASGVIGQSLDFPISLPQ